MTLKTNYLGLLNADDRILRYRTFTQNKISKILVTIIVITRKMFGQIFTIKWQQNKKEKKRN